ncbi:hypothetical protein CAI21_21835 [Alkalilimnicola ehrlichii]|uniref:YqaJ viral recombinase domain-containing protein n=1 Tax=Alkalilimnicola ehrlichii TaxID=351052 RepID=A0A3E0WHF2_9GAMM|nr:YqaJ viral recombinase family protein [Alkalilimnicola ehrlichii]RFA24384.1 hypothetical protein CAI21_21835 [Alkalilimnicola ehrlichii]RFA31577.1 hypothetical protein CAL65_22170 [Alkalilimnicola ehrlichii]
MSAIIPLHHHQDTPAWHSYRERMGNASETGALMGCSPWFPRTPHELWLVKTGRASVETTPAMRRGLLLEQHARAYAEQILDEVFEPQVVAHERLSASLDGLSFDGRWVLEIKCPLKGANSATWQTIEATGKPPLNYWWQVQQQLLCAKAEGAHFLVCEADEEEIRGCLRVDIRPDAEAQAALVESWTEFFEHLDDDTPPPLSPTDVVVRHDREWRDAVAEWKESRRWLDEAQRAETQARKRLIEMAGDYSTSGAGIKLTRFWKKGDIDWRRATQGMNLEPFRKPGRWQHRISEQDQ